MQNTRQNAGNRSSKRKMALAGLCAFVTLLGLTMFNSAPLQAQGSLILPMGITANNGSSGISFEVTALQPVQIYRLWSQGSAGTNTVEIYYNPTGLINTPNSSTGYNSTGWISLGQAVFTGVGYGTDIEIPFNINLRMNQGDRWGFAIRTVSGGVSYRSGTTPYVFSDAYLSVNTQAWGGAVPNTWSFWPRQFCGRISYDPVASVPNDIGIASIDSPTSFCAGTHPVSVTLKNSGTNQVTSATINWSINGTPQTAYSWTGLLDTLSVSTRETSVTLGNRNFLAGVPYTIVAWTTNPNGVPDTVNNNDTATVIVKAALSGTYTIGGVSPNYATFTAAVDDLISSGVCGPVTFTVASGTYTETITIPEIAGASSTNTITFDGGAGNAATRILQYSCPNANDRVVALNGADYVRFRNLTIRATGSSYGWGVLFTNSADYNEITDCVIEAYNGSSSSNFIGILGSSTTSNSTSGDHGNFNLIQDNTITGGYYGIRWNGSGTTDYTTARGNQFINNTVTDWYYSGVYLNYGGQLMVKGNRSVQRSSGIFTTSSGYAYYVNYPNDGPEISYNYGFSASYLFYIYRPNYYYTSSSNRAKVYNNMGATNGTSTCYGLYVNYPRFTDVVYNSVYLKTTSTVYGIYCYGETTAYDNKFANNYIVREGNGTFYAQYLMNSNTALDYSLFDHNAFYRIGTSGTTYYHWQGTSYTSLPALQAAVSGFHQNSVYGDPYFASETDLHCNSDVGYLAGVSFPGITDDFDGDQRGPNPCIGADEYPEPPPLYDVAITDVRLNYADTKWTRKEGVATHSVDVVLENNGRLANPNGISITYKVGSVPASEFDGVQQTFNPAWSGDKTVVSFTQKVTGALPAASVPVYAKVFWPLDAVPLDNTGIDVRRIDNEKVHGREDFNSMLAPDFSDDPGYLDYDWSVNNAGGAATWAVANGVGSGGTHALEYPGDTQTADDWVFTPGATLLAEASYRIAFNMKSVSGAPQRVEVAYGMSPDPGSMTTFATFANFTNTGFMTAKQLAGGLDPYFNTPNQAGMYYIGFRVTSNAGAGAVVIDDIVC
ncbi:MAG: hypothetical protein M5R41_09915 [Bacteroidia bacterium]|nr:hypothetical protein [Bacteroidia bacterium]